jgi:hypothetical protein
MSLYKAKLFHYLCIIFHVVHISSENDKKYSHVGKYWTGWAKVKCNPVLHIQSNGILLNCGEDWKHVNKLVNTEGKK